MPDDALPPLREVIATHNLRAERKFGQNFILDLNLTQRIARAGGDLSECSVIEIGPGPGGLTRGLLMSGARKVIVIEADARFLPALEDIKTAYPDRLEIVQGDALQTFPDSLTAEPYRIISNLPYNIATPLFTGWLENSWQGDRMGTTLFVHNLHVPKGSCPAHCRRPGHQQLRAFIGSGRMVDPGPHFVRCRPSGFRTAAQCHIKHCACGTTRLPARRPTLECCRKSQPRLSDSDGKCCVPA